MVTLSRPHHLSVSLCLTLSCLGALAQAPVAPSVFDIAGYRIQGNTLLDERRLTQATAPFVGAKSSFETIQQALESLERAYVSAGYGLVRVEVPEQELTSGVVTLQVLEGKLADVSIEPHAHFDADNIRRSLPALRPGEPVNLHDLNRNLTLANESGYKVTNVTFKRGSSSRNEVDATVKLAAEKPERWLALLENTGSEGTGRYRLGMVYQNGNVANLDHSLALQWMTSPDHLEDVHILGVSYRIPIYSLGDAVSMSLSASNVDSGQLKSAGGGPDLDISGSGLMLGVHYTRHLKSTAQWQQSLVFGLEHRAYGNSVMLTGEPDSLVPDLTTHPFTATYNSAWRSAARDTTASLTWLKNLPGGSNGSTADFNQPGGRSGADAGFQTLKFSLQHTERLASQWSLRAALSGQTTNDLLIAAEQFGVGGADSVRGLDDRGVAGDKGVQLGLELWAPPINADPWRMVPLVFLDAARVSRNRPAPGEIASQTLASAGIGLRAAYGTHFSLRLDWGYVFNGVSDSDGPDRSEQKLHATAAWVF